MPAVNDMGKSQALLSFKGPGLAMYKVKDSGRNNHRIFVQDMAAGIPD